MEVIINDEGGTKETKTESDEVISLKQDIKLIKNNMYDFQKAISNHIKDIKATIDETITAVKERSSEQFLANSFLVGMDKTTNVGMIEKLSNDYMFGDEKYPKTMHAAYKYAKKL